MNFLFILLPVEIGALLITLLVLALVNSDRNRYRRRLDEYAETIRNLKAQLERPRAPKEWTRG